MSPALRVDGATEAVLSVSEFLAWWELDSVAGRRRASALVAYGEGERGAWEREVRRAREAEQWAWEDPERERVLRRALAELPDMQRVLRRLELDEALDEADLFSVKRFLYYAQQAIDAAAELVGRDADASMWAEKADEWMGVIHPEKKRTSRFHLASRLDAELAARRGALRRLKREAKVRRDALEADVVEAWGGRFNLRGEYEPDDLEGLGVEAALSQDERIDYVAGVWRLADAALRARDEEIDRLQEEVGRVERRVCAELSERLRREAGWLVAVREVLAEVDLQLAKGRLRARLQGCWPRWSEEGASKIVGGRPFGVLRGEGAERAQPIDVRVGEAPVVVTGPNMGGKSVLLRLVGLCQWAAQHGLPVPASDFEFVPVGALVYVGSEEPRAAGEATGLSSFGREVARLVEWWERGDSPRLWLLDELGRGTHPDEGASIAVEVIEALRGRGDRCVAATHFPAVAGMAGAERLRIAGLSDREALEALLREAGASDPEGLRGALRQAMDYRPLPVEGGAGVPRDARLVARALGLAIGDG